MTIYYMKRPLGEMMKNDTSKEVFIMIDRIERIAGIKGIAKGIDRFLNARKAMMTHVGIRNSLPAC